MKNSTKGFGLISIIITIAVIVALGGGVYVATKSMKSDTAVNGEVSSTVSPSVSVLGTTTKGTLKSLLSLTNTTVCTVGYATSSVSVSGTVYVAGSMVRADTTSTTKGSAPMDAHMIKTGDMIYAWTGTQGAKMSFTDLEKNSSVAAQQSVDLNQEVTYTCKDWPKDESKFSIPTNVKFIDISALLNAKTGISGGTTIQNQCSACASIPDKAAQAQCKAALQCK